MEATETLYDALGVAENASYAQIRSRYLSAVLQLHPDKQHPTSQHPLHIPGFLRLQEAWNVLRDPSSRASYDRNLASSRSDSSVTELLRLEEMSREPTSNDDDDGDGEGVSYVYPCRCGDFFVVSLKELKELGFSEMAECVDASKPPPHHSRSLVLPCSSCSLQIGVLF